MDWIKRSEQEPSPLLGKILVWSECGNPHVAFYDYGSWCHSTFCGEYDAKIYHGCGLEIDFDYWAYAPKGPVTDGMD